jgi:hypothetical protein
MQILDNIGSRPFISWAISMKLSDYIFFMPTTDVPSFVEHVEKYPKIKYAISDRPPLAATGPLSLFVKHLFYY